jgi:AcrR family transcriptional regulator
MAGSLQSRKQELVRVAIHDAAIELFAANGFDGTTVEEVAKAAGVSRRSFFRYFASKDDLLAQDVLNYGKALATAVAACAPSLSPMEVIRETVAAGVKYVASQPQSRQTIEIAVKSPSARQAYQSRLIDVEDMLAEGFAARTRSGSKDDLRSKMLATLALQIMNLTIASWFSRQYESLPRAARQVFANLTRLLCEKPPLSAASMPLLGSRSGRRRS